MVFVKLGYKTQCFWLFLNFFYLNLLSRCVTDQLITVDSVAHFHKCQLPTKIAVLRSVNSVGECTVRGHCISHKLFQLSLDSDCEREALSEKIWLRVTWGLAKVRVRHHGST